VSNYDDGDCFIVSARYIIASTNDSIKLVHGIATGQGHIKGIKHYHSWLEINGNTVVDLSNGRTIIMPTKEYYDIGHIDETGLSRYSYKEALDNLLSYGHYGPWEQIAEIPQKITP